MAAVLLSAFATCFAALFIGQAALRLAGAAKWSWLAPMVGLSVCLLLAALTIHLPGRTTTMAILLAGLTLAAAVWCLRSPPHRPPPADLLAALPVVFLAALPFLAAGRGGVLGVTVNNDMAVHLGFVETFLHPSIAAVHPLPTDYPLGPHALAAILSRGLGVAPEYAFSGWTMAIPILTAWTVLAAARNAAWYGKAIAATVVALPYLVAAYYGEGSFKEVAQAGLVLAVVLCLAGCGPRLGRGRWVPLALLVGGIVSDYSPAGLAWVFAVFGLWLAGLLVVAARQRRLHEVPRALRGELPALAVALAALALLLIVQADRLYEFVSSRNGTGIATSDIGNLVGRLPLWEGLGIWNSPDFRLPATPIYSGGILSWFVVGLVLFGAFWAFRRGRWLLPLAALAALAIWAYSDHSQSIYVAGKALVIASPLLLLLAALPLLDREPRPWPSRPRWAWLLVPLLGLGLLVLVGRSDVRALRFSPVGPSSHAHQLQSFAPLIAGRQVLFLGTDEFSIWELAGSSFRPLALGPFPQVALRPKKKWEPGQAADFDTVPASTLNEFEWIITTRDAAGSEAPPQIRLVRATEAFALWKRVGRVRERSILHEQEWPGAVLDCNTARGRAVLAAGGIAAVRRLPLVAAGANVGPGDSFTVTLQLPAGSWELESPYVSHLPVQVTAPGFSKTLPANLERPGQRLPIGRVTVQDSQQVVISFQVDDTLFAPDTATAEFPFIVATPVGVHDRIVPIAQACGKYVDWYRSAQ